MLLTFRMVLTDVDQILVAMQRCRKTFQYRGLQGHFLWFKSVHVRNYLIVALSPKVIREGGGCSRAPLPTSLR